MKRQQGFGIVEIMIVVVILGILLALVWYAGGRPY